MVITGSTQLTPFCVATDLLLDVNATVLLIFVDNPTNGIVFHIVFYSDLQRRHLMDDIIIYYMHPLRIIDEFVVVMRPFSRLSCRLTITYFLQRCCNPLPILWAFNLFLIHT